MRNEDTLDVWPNFIDQLISTTQDSFFCVPSFCDINRLQSISVNLYLFVVIKTHLPYLHF